VTKKN